MWPFTSTTTKTKSPSREEREAERNRLAAQYSAKHEKEIRDKIYTTLGKLPDGSSIISVKVNCVTKEAVWSTDHKLYTSIKIARAMWRDPSGQFYMADFDWEGCVKKAILVSREPDKTSINVSQTCGLIVD